MLRQGLCGYRVETYRKSTQGDGQHDSVKHYLLPHFCYAPEQMRVHISHQQHQLKKENTRGPYGRRSSKVRKEHLADHRLAHEKQKGTQKYRRGDGEESQSLNASAGRQPAPFRILKTIDGIAQRERPYPKHVRPSRRRLLSELQQRSCPDPVAEYPVSCRGRTTQTCSDDTALQERRDPYSRHLLS